MRHHEVTSPVTGLRRVERRELQSQCGWPSSRFGRKRKRVAGDTEGDREHSQDDAGEPRQFSGLLEPTGQGRHGRRRQHQEADHQAGSPAVHRSDDPPVGDFEGEVTPR